MRKIACRYLEMTTPVPHFAWKSGHQGQLVLNLDQVSNGFYFTYASNGIADISGYLPC